MEIIFSVPPIHDQKYTAVDTEWFGMDKNLLHRPTTGKFACLQICYDPETVYMVVHEEDVPLAMERIKDDIWVMHNAKFDITQLRRFVPIPPRKKLWDTMIIERILYNGYYDLFSLKDVSRRYLQEILEKEARDFFEKATTLDERTIQYAARDVSITLRVQQEQLKIVTKNDMYLWHNVDRPAMFALMDFMGFRIDGHQWIELAKENEKKAVELEAQLPYNPRSHAKAKQFLISKGFKGLKSNSEEDIRKSLAKYPDSEAATYAKIHLESSMYYTRKSRYGVNMFEKHREVDPDYPGIFVIVANYEVTGAETGRTSSSKPNMQNIPWRDTKLFRKCFIARYGRKLIILDYSAQEPRITAYLSGDPKLIKIFQDGKDIYTEMAYIIFGERIQKSDKRRSTMKGVVLGMSYGLSKYGLAEREGIPVDDAEKFLDAAWDKFPVARAYVDKQKQLKSYATTIMGRRCYLNPHSKQSENNALNDPVQGSASDMTKLALIETHRDWNYDLWGKYAVVEESHDEIGIDAPEEYATKIAEFARVRMVRVAEKMCPGIPFVVDVHIGDSWADKE